MKWILALPCWGDAYVDLFTRFGSKSLARQGLDGHDVEVIAYTDRPILPALWELAKETGWAVTFRPEPKGLTAYEQFAAAHRDAYEHARPGDRVAFLCADFVLSRGALGACETRFARDGMQAIACVAPRTVGSPPIDENPEPLLRWAMSHQHPITQQLFWGRGVSATPWTVYFQDDDLIVCRGLHLHPLAAVKRPGATFAGTCDADLLDIYPRDNIHVVCSNFELAVVEMTPVQREVRTRGSLSPASIVNWAVRRTSSIHWWLAEHRIIVVGGSDTEPDIGPWRAIRQYAIDHGVLKEARGG